MSTEDGSSSELGPEHLGMIKRLLGWLTADRRLEAEGLAEQRTSGRPSEAEVERTEHEMKKYEYHETQDAPRTSVGEAT